MSEFFGRYIGVTELIEFNELHFDRTAAGSRVDDALAHTMWMLLRKCKCLNERLEWEDLLSQFSTLHGNMGNEAVKSKAKK